MALAPRNAMLQPRSLAAVTCQRGPVLVVPRRDQGAGAVQQAAIPGDVDAGEVGQRDADALGQVYELALVHLEQVRAGVVIRPVEADGQRPVTIASVGSQVEVILAPRVVCLPGRDPALEHDLACRALRPDSDRDVTLA